MLLTSWVRSFRQSLQNRRRGNRRGLDWQTQSLHGDAGRSSRQTEQLEDRMLLTAFVVDQQFVDANSGPITISNSTIDIDSDGTPEFDSIVFDDATISGVGGVGINVILSDLVLNRIVFQGVELGDQATGDNQTSGINITLNDVDLDAIAFDDTTVFSGFGGGIDINLTDVQMDELAIFNSTITGGLNAGVTIDVASVSRNAVIEELAISGSTIDGMTLTAVGIQKSVIGASQTNPIVITVPDHGLQSGAEVKITDVAGLTAANTRDTITVLDENTFELNNTDGTGDPPYGGGGTLTTTTDVNNIRIVESNISGSTGLDGLAISLTDARAPGLTIQDNESIDSIDLSLTRTPIDGLQIRGNEAINANRPQVNAVNFDLDDSTLTNVIIDGNVIDRGVSASGGEGVVFTAVDSNVYGSFSDNVVQRTLGAGLKFVGTASDEFQTENRGPLVFDFSSVFAETSITSTITNSDTTIEVVDGRAFQAQQIVVIEDEHIFVESVSGNTLTVRRGQNGTLALSHASGSRLRSVTSSRSGVARTISGNTFSANAGAGITASLGDGAALNADITTNMFLNNAGGGVDVAANDTRAASTTIQRGGISRTATTLNVNDASPFSNFNVPFDVLVDGERMTVTAVDGNSLTVDRAVQGTAASFHATNATVTAATGDALDLNIGDTDASLGNVFDSNQGDAISLLLNDEAAGTLDVVGNTIINTGIGSGAQATDENGIQISMTGTQINDEATAILRRSFISNNLIGVASVSTLPADLPIGTSVFQVVDGTGFNAANQILIDGEVLTIQSINGNIITLTAPTTVGHLAGAAVLRTAGGNSGRAIDIFFDEQTAVEDLQITGNTIANNLDDGVRITREDDAVTRTVNPFGAQSRAITIAANTISNNALNPTTEQLQSGGSQQYGAGLEIVVRNGDLDQTDIEVRDNTISRNARTGGGLDASATNGINLRAEADSQLLVDMTNNVINFSEGDGVSLSTRENSTTDQRDIGGTWTKNDFSDNGQNGIDILGRFGIFNLLVVGIEGVDSVDGRSLGNSIRRNQYNGMNIRRGGNASIVNNDFFMNGLSEARAVDVGAATPNRTFGFLTEESAINGSGIHVANGGNAGAFVGLSQFNRDVNLDIKTNTFESNRGMGIDINSIATSGITVSATIRENLITQNRNDGIEISGKVEATMLGNFIDRNEGRGIDLMSFGTGGEVLVQSNYKIGNGQIEGRNTVVGNRQEGIYYVNSSADQDQNLLSTNDNSRLNNGSVISWPAAILQIDSNQIDANGIDNGSSGSGIVLWIGTSGGELADTDRAFNNATGTATGAGSVGGVADPINHEFVDGDFNSNITFDGAVNSRTNARIVNNTFDGNFGDDFTVEAFVSTVDPPATNGNWDLNQVPPYILRRYDSDPLSRLNLQFEGNQGDGISVRNQSVFYSNAEPQWKRRLAANPPRNPVGPFGAPEIARDATRVPSRTFGGFPLAPFQGAPLNGAPEAIYNITDIQPVDVGNGISSLQLTLTPSSAALAAYGATLPDIFNGNSGFFGDGATVEIYRVFSVDGTQHSANGVYRVQSFNAVARTVIIENTAGENGPAYGFGGTLVINHEVSTGGDPPFQYSGMGPTTFRVAQGYDTSGSQAQNEFSDGDNFFEFVTDGDGPRTLPIEFDEIDWGIWTPNRSLNGVITNVTSTAGTVTVTSPNHGLTNKRLVEFSRINGIPNANSTFIITVTGPDTFTFNRTVDGVYIDGGEWKTRDESFPDPNAPTFPISNIVDVTPDPRTNATGVVTLNFSEPVTNLDVGDLFLTHDGVPVDISGIPVQQVTQTQYTVDLSFVTTGEGQYELTIDNTFPEATIVPINPDPRTESAGVVTINFTEDVTGVDIGDFVLSLDTGDSNGFQAIDLSERTGTGNNLAVTQISSSQYAIDLSGVTDEVGTYRLTLLAPKSQAITAIGGQAGLGTPVSIESLQHGLSTGQTVTISGATGGMNGLGTVVNGTHRIVVTNPDNFVLFDDTLTTAVLADEATYGQTSTGFGSWSFDPEIIDRVGKAYSVDQFNVTAEATEVWARSNTAPTADIIDVSPDPRNSIVPSVIIQFSERVNSTQFTNTDLRLFRDVGAGFVNVPLGAANDPVPLDADANGFATRFEVFNLGAVTSIDGDYRLTLITTDTSRISDQQGSFLNFPTSDEWTVVTTGPAPTLTEVFPDPRQAPADIVQISFNVDVTGVDTADASTHLTLTRDTGDGTGPQVVPLVDPGTNMPLPLTVISPSLYQIDLTPVTGNGVNSIDGAYTLTLNRNTGITATLGGQATVVDATDSWVQDSTVPTVDILDISPDPRVDNAGIVTVKFSEQVSGLNRNNAAADFTLTIDRRDGNGPQNVSLTGIRVRPLSPVQADGTPIQDPFTASLDIFSDTFVIDLSSVTDEAGDYVLSLTASSGVADRSLNSLVITPDASDSWTRIANPTTDRLIDFDFPGIPIPPILFLPEIPNPVVNDAVDSFFVDATPPQVVPGSVNVTPDPRSTAVGILTIDFTEPVVGFNLTDLVLTRGGVNVPLNGLTLNQVTQSRYTIDLNLTTGAPGVYELSIQGAGSLIEDLAGNPIQASSILLDNWTVENIGPSATVSVAPDPRTTPANNVMVSFTKEVEVVQVDVSDFRLERDTGSGFTEIVLTGTSIMADSPSMGFDDLFLLDLSAAGLTDVEATYRLTLVAADSGIVDQAGIELASDAFDIWVLDNTNPTVDIIDIVPDPRQTEVGTVNIIFSEGVTGVDINDFVLLSDTGGGLTPVDISALTVSQQTDLRYTLDLTTVTAVDEATYELRLVTNDGVSPVTDLAGNALLVDGSLSVADTAALDSWFRGADIVNPMVSISTVTTPRANAAGVVTFTFSEDVSGVDIGDIELTLDTGSGAMPVDISGLSVTAAPGSATQYELDLSTVTVTQGAYVLRVVTTDATTPIVDSAGNALDPSISAGVADEILFTVQTIDPSAVITPVAPDPRLRDAGLVTVTFSQDVQGVDISDFSLTRDTGIGAQPVSLQSVSVIENPSGPGASQYVIDLTSVTGSDGVYVLTLTAAGSGITAVATGDPMTSDAIESWATITTITVNTTNDSVDVNPGDGVVADAGGNVSLRAAIMESNALAGDDTIVVPAGTYILTLGGVGDNASVSGDLDIAESTGALTIVGAGAGLTIIDAQSLERVFHILGGATLNLQGVTVTGGLVTGSEDGGGIRNDGGTVSIVDSVITGNVSQDDAGGINNTGDLTLTRVTVSDNAATRTGGGIRNAGTLTINASTIGGASDPLDPLAVDLRNTSVLAGGGIVNLGTGVLVVNNTTIAGNVASSSAAQGAGLYSIGTATLTNVTISENEAGGAGGGLAVAGGSTMLLNTLIGGNTTVVGGPNRNDFFQVSSGLITSLGNNFVQDGDPFGTLNSPFVDPNPMMPVQPNVNGDIIGIDPLISSLSDNGGPTATVAVMPGSLAIDAGADTTDATDQRGIIRGLDDFSIANAGQRGIDIGAYETGGFFVNSLGDTIDVNPGDGIAADQFGNTTLRAAIMEANALPGDSTIILADGIHELSLIELDEIAPTADIVDVSPDPLSAELSGLDPVDEITVNFSEPIQGLDLSSAATDFTLTLNDGTVTSAIPLTGVTIRMESDTQYVLEGLTTLLAADGLYTLQLDTDPVTPNITDFALSPNGLAADPSDLTGMIAAVDTFVRGADVFAPTATISDIATPRSTNPGLVTVTFDEPVIGVDLSSNPANFTLEFDDGVLPPQTVSLATVSVQQVTSSVYTLDLTTVLDFNSLTDIGTYTLTFDGTATTIFDFAANAFAGAPLIEVWTVALDTVAPSADIVDVSPDPRIGAVGVVTVNFTEDVTGVDLIDAETDFDLFFDVDGAGTGVAAVQVPLVDAMNAALVVTQISDSEYTIDLTDVTAADGEYTLVLTTDGMIVDGVSNPLEETLGTGVTAEDVWLTGDSLETDDRAGAFGDLDVRDASLGGQLTIIGSGAGTSLIDANSIDRVFDVEAGSRLRLENLTVTGGQVVGGKDGAGIRSEGLVVLSGAEITANSADRNGGGVYAANSASTTTLSANASLTATTITVADAVGLGTTVPGFLILVGSEQMLVTGITGNTLTVVRGANTSTPTAHDANETVSLLHLAVSESTLTSNSADFGAGVFVDGGTVSIVGSTLQGNMATTDGGAVYIDQAARVDAAGSALLSNTAGRDGGGFYNNATAALVVTDTTVSSNSAVQDGGGLFNEIVASSTLSNARFSGNTAANGGGIYNEDGVVSVSGGSLIANAASEDGGAVFTSSSATTTLTNTTLSGNAATRDGGGVRNDGSMTVTSVNLAGNSAGRDGGAIINNRTLTVTGSMFTGNTAAGSGGALDLNSIGVVSLTSSTLRGNTATVNGGGISNNEASQLTLSEMTVDGNSVTGNGGGVFHSSSAAAIVTSTTISNNQAANGGGVSSTGPINLTNATITSNVASSDGGGLHNTSTATLLGVTIANNMATGNGGGISSENTGGNASLKNTLVARNSAATNADINGSAFLNLGNNLIGDGGSVTTFVHMINGNLVGSTGAEIDPLLSPLQDNGGATLTHALLFGSPARDNGNNVGVPAFDQRGFDRRFDGDGDGNVTVDIGAFESGLTVNSFLDTVDVNPGERSSADEAGNSTLRAAVMEANALPGADTIVLLPGTYRLTIAGQDENDSRSGDLDITESLTIIGAGDGSTIIDASGLDRAFHVIAGASLDLKGVTVINGDATVGGAILNQGTFATEDVTISGSSALLGGGIYNDVVEDELSAGITAGASTLTVEDVSVFPRQAGFLIQIGSEQLQVDFIAGNTLSVTRGVNATSAAAHAAGDVVTVVATSVVSLLNTTVTGNAALLNGGGIFNNDTLNVTLSSVSGNSAGVRGGGLYNTETAVLDRSTFDGNLAEVRGGAIFNEGTTLSSPSTVVVNASTISNNVTGVRGGAIFNSQSLTISNSTISGNEAGGEGAGVFNTGPDAASSGTTTVVNSTIVANSTDLSAGGIFNDAGSTVLLTNSIIAGNLAESSNNDVQGAFDSVRSNFVGDSGDATGLVNGENGNLVGTTLSPIDPVLGALANNGGPAQTHELLIGSPAIDAGDNSGGEPLDQRGGRRPTDLTADIGAFEVQSNNLSIDDVTLVEGSAGSTLFVFTVLLESVAADPVTIFYGTVQDSAQQGSDFIGTAGTLVFAPGELSKTITVEVNGDTTTESTEQFFVQLFNPINAVLSNDRGTGTILNDDAIVTFDDVDIVEGDSGTSTATFNVVLSNPTSEEITLDYQTSAGTATEGVAALGGDYEDTNGSLIFAAGETAKSFSVMINGDTTVEAFETFFANLTLASGSVQLPDPQAIGTIQNDDVALANISSPSVTELTGSNNTVSFTVGLTQLNAFDVTVDVQTVDGTATGGNDYVALSPTTVTIPAGTLSVTQDVTIIGDTDFEGGATGTPETFNLEYVPATITRNGAAASGTLGTAGTASITDDELPPTVWVIRVNAGTPTMGEVLRDGTDNGVFDPVIFAPLTPFNLVDPLVVNGDAGTQNDRFIVDFVNGNPIPAGGLTVDGGDETSGDSLEIVDTDLVTPFFFDSVVYTSTGVDSGTVLIADGDAITPLTRTITYAELEPVLDSIAAVDRTFTINSVANPGDHVIDVANAGGRTIISDNGTSAFESVEFANPTSTLTLNAGEGDNTITVGALDAGFAAAVVAGTRSVSINAEGGNDNLTATATNIALSIVGGDGADVLLGGGQIDTIDGGSGADSIEGGAGGDSLTGGDDDDTVKGDAGVDTINGGAGNDSIEGGTEGDTLIGGDDDDTILGQDGDDNIDGGLGTDSLDGGAGNDTITGGDGGDNISGGTGMDSLDGGGDADTLDGGDDNDTVIGGSGTDIVAGGLGDDSVDGGDDNDTLSGGGGTDMLVGGDGDDQVAEVAVDAETIVLTDTVLTVGGLADSVDGVEEFILTGGNLSSLIDASGYTLGNVTINGVGGDDTLIGSNGDDFINGGGGNDTLTGGLGNDSLLGGAGNDSADGGSANDTLVGNSGNDTLNGGTGLDSIDGGDGGDLIDGGDDNDTALGGAGSDSINGGLGNDRLLGEAQDDTLSGDDGDDTLIGGAGGDSVLGGAGIDNLNGQSGRDDLDGGADDDTVFGGAGQDTLTGGQGVDNLDGQGSSFDVIRLVGEATDDVFTLDRSMNFNLLRKTSGTTYGVNFKRTETIEINTLDGNDTITVIGDLLGSDGDAAFVIDFGNGANLLDASLNTDAGKAFIVTAGTGNDTLRGSAGEDNLNGASGDDSIDGGGGEDTLTGGAGADILNGNGGADLINGGTENDTISGGTEADTLNAGDGDDSVRGGDGNDTIAGEDGNDLLYGDAGNDSITGGRGDDSIDGGDNDDTVLGERGFDVIKGGDGTDSLVGGDHDDTIDGGNGNDLVNGNLGRDVLLGGADNDVVLGGSDGDTLLGGTGADDIRGQGSGSDVLVGETGLAGASDDTPDAGDTFDALAEIDNAFVLDTAILDKLNSF